MTAPATPAAVVYEDLTEEERYLFCILQDLSGIDQGSFLWNDQSNDDGCWRPWDFQVKWWRNTDRQQIDQSARSVGKALDLSTPIKTRSGWKRMGDLVVGDEPYDENGAPCKVVDAFDVMEGRPCMEVEFDDHSTIVADESHQWVTRTRRDPELRVRTTGEIADSLDQFHVVPLATPFKGEFTDLPLAPYTLGLWLGDGSSYYASIICGDQDADELVRQIEGDGYAVKPNVGLNYYVSFPEAHNRMTESVTAVLRRMHLLKNRKHHKDQTGHKHVPQQYLNADYESRLALVQGIMDSDGHCTKNGRCEITLKSRALAEGVRELLVGLGQKVYFESRQASCQTGARGEVFRLGFVPQPGFQPFRLPRKAERVKGMVRSVGVRRVVAVRRVPTVPVRCIAVDSPSRLFLAGTSLVPTHNSMSVMARACAFPFVHPGQEMVITAPELVHLEPIVSKIEAQMYAVRLYRELLERGRSGVTHRPFQMNFVNQSRIIGRIPQKDGKGVKGCLGYGELVWTDKGLVKVEDIQVGDLVLTHEGRFKPVLNVVHDVNDCYEVVGQQSFPLTVSCDHRFMVVDNEAGPKQKRRFSDPLFVDVEVLDENYYWASPTKFPTLPVPMPQGFSPSTDFWWLVGRYLADGCLANNGQALARVVWIAPDGKADALLAAAQAVGVNMNRHKRAHSSADEFQVSSRALAAWLEEHFGRLAGGKRLPTFVLGMDEAHRNALLEGYLAGDGWFSQNKKRWEVSSASKALMVGMQMLAQSLGCTVNCSSTQPKTTEIAGATLKNTPQMAWRLQIRDSGHPAQIGDHRYAKLKSVTPVGKRPIVNLVVEGDHSYVSGSIVSHNIHPVWLEMDECFPAGTLVLTKSGWEPIERVEIGTEVFTHKNRWRRVTKTFDRGLQDMVSVRGMGHPGLVCSANHKFWVSQEVVTLGPSINAQGGASAKRQKSLTEPSMVRASDLGPGTFWATPTRLDFEGHVPSLTGVGQRRGSGWEYGVDLKSPDWAWLCGNWAAEGSASATQLTWSVHSDEVPTVTARMNALSIPYSVYPQSASPASNITVYSPPLCSYMKTQFGAGAHNKTVPVWTLRLKSRAWRQAFFDGAIYGDGNAFQNGWTYTTVSKQLALGMSMLANGLDYQGVGVYLCDPSGCKPSVIRGREVRRAPFYQIRVSRTSNETYTYDKKRWRRIREVERLDEQMHCYDLEVEDDHSFVVEGNVVSNSQDYPHAGWVELTETVNKAVGGATWRAHGVTRGVRDDFYRHTKDSPDNPWTVHRFPAMIRPTWTDQEREDKIQQYGSRDDPDYRRNVLGFHGDAMQPIFVLSRLMAAVDDDITSDYNINEYAHLNIKNETLMLMDQDILDVLQYPSMHLRYLGQDRSASKAAYWVGMDIGMTRDPSEILVFVEFREKPKDDLPKLKLLTRVSMTRVGVTDQTKAILSVVDFYKPRVFAMDRGGLGLPFVQLIKEMTTQPNLQPDWAKPYRLEDVLSRIKGYNFGEKIVVDFDPSIDITDSDDPGKDAGMRRNTKEYGIDKLRELVDNRQLILPWDEELLGQFQGGTVSARAGLDQYGHRRFAKGDDHTLDAAVMMTLGYRQYSIEEFLTREKVQTPILDAFVAY